MIRDNLLSNPQPREYEESNLSRILPWLLMRLIIIVILISNQSALVPFLGKREEHLITLQQCKLESHKGSFSIL